MKPHIVLIHGLYMNRLSMKLLEKQFKKEGFTTSIFTYPSMLRRTEKHARSLIKFIHAIDQPCAIVAHSLGGLVIRKALSIEPDLPITHVVACGVPFKGADIARILKRIHISLLIGNVINDLIILDQEKWQYSAKLGVISGTNKTGLGRILINGNLPSDGTVYVSETIVEGMTDQIEVPYSHTGMLFQANIAKQAIQFILNNRFQH